MRVVTPLSIGLTVVLVAAIAQTFLLPTGIWNALSNAAVFQEQCSAVVEHWQGIRSASSGTEDAEMQNVGLNSVASTISPPRTLSIHPLQTQASLVGLATAVAMLLSATILFREKLTLLLLFGAISLPGLAVALLGIYQVVTGNWTLLEGMRSTSFGTFVGRNSAPQFFASALGAMISLLAIYRATQKKVDRRYGIKYPSVNLLARLRRRVDDFIEDADFVSALCMIGIVVLLIATVAANSRGGILSAFAAGLATASLVLLGKLKSANASLGIGLLVVGTGIFLTLFQLDDVIVDRLETVSAEAHRLDNARFELWQDALSLRSNWLFGTGLGTFHFAILPAQALDPKSVWFYHAENIYIELLSNFGLWTSIVMLAGLGHLLWFILWRQPNTSVTRAARVGCAYAVLAVALHGLTDFSLIIPGVFLPLACLVGAFLGASHHDKNVRRVRKIKHRVRDAREEAMKQFRFQDADTQPAARPLAAKANEELRSAHRHARANRLWVASATLAVTLGMLIGWPALGGFAFAEQLAKKKIGADEEGLKLEELQDLRKSKRAEFPEVRLQLGRLLQDAVTSELRQADIWPEAMNQQMREKVTQPEFFTTAIIDFENPLLSDLRGLIQEQAQVLELMRDSEEDMAAALIACPQDWRAGWGLMRGDARLLSSEERIWNYARLRVLCGRNPRVLLAMANQSLMSGDRAIGLDVYRDLLPLGPMAEGKIVELLGSIVGIDEFLEIAPDSAVSRIRMTQKLRSRQSPFWEQVLASVDLTKAFEEASGAATWQQVAWAASELGDIQLQIDARQEAALSAPMDHRINYARAQALEQSGDIKEAIVEMNRALSHDPNNTSYLDMKKRLTSP